MKTVFHVVALTLAIAAVPACANADTLKELVGTSLTSSPSTISVDAANRKGSKRTGGTNSKGKGSKYRGGRK